VVYDVMVEHNNYSNSFIWAPPFNVTAFLTLQTPVVRKLAQPQNADPWYIRGSVRDMLELHFKC